MIFWGKMHVMKNYPSARGIMFEMYVIHLFQSGNDRFDMRQLLKGQDHPSKTTFSIDKSRQIGYIRTAREISQYERDYTLIIPNVSNFGAADLLYTPNAYFSNYSVQRSSNQTSRVS